MKTFWLSLFSLLILFGCSSSDDSTPKENPEDEAMYFPANNSNEWETTTPSSLNYNNAAIQPLLTFLEEKHTKSFLILVNGRIVMENYFNGHTANTPWYWASAGKTLTSTVTGIAADEGILNINNKVSDYLGTGWTSASTDKENLITCKHLLTMTSGLNDEGGDSVAPENLHYLADAGTRWAYDNVYVKMQDVVATASGTTWDTYFNVKLKNKIGMTGAWTKSGDDLSVYLSNTRSMARFGLLMLNKGNWNGSQIVSQEYLSAATATSQQINKSYGYLWWINGEESYHMPQTQIQFQGSLIPTGPADMYMALGKNDQKIYVIPSKKMVVIRMGDAADEENWALSGFDNELWVKINALIN